MAPRVNVHEFSAGSREPVASYVEGANADDEGAPPSMPANTRITRDDVVIGEATSPQSEMDLVAKREVAAAKLKAAPKRLPRVDDFGFPGQVQIMPHPDPRALRARCLEIAAKGSATEPAEIIAQARELYAFVEVG